jgi:hypothetical protein
MLILTKYSDADMHTVAARGLIYVNLTLIDLPGRNNLSPFTSVVAKQATAPGDGGQARGFPD